MKLNIQVKHFLTFGVDVNPKLKKEKDLVEYSGKTPSYPRCKTEEKMQLNIKGKHPFRLELS